jgi:hypothetical protein
MPQEKSRGLVLLFLLMCVVALVSAFQALYIERLLTTGLETAAAADRDTASALVAIADYRAAEAGYLAIGQQPAFWMTRADTLASTMSDVMAREGAATPSSQARAAFEEAGGALDDLRKLDTRARTLVHSGQPLVASDVIFMDSLQASTHVVEALGAAREADRDARALQIARLGEVRLAALGGAMGIGLIGSWILLGRARTSGAPDLEVAAPVPAPSPSLSLGSIQPPVKPAPAAAEISLTEAAGLCTDLARVLDLRDIPALFERAAHVLEAKGLVLWVVDASGALLEPSLTQGYPEKVRLRMSGLQIDGDNATALAYRSMQPQVVGGAAPSGAGALAVPLITATGCVGVLSAEVKTGRPAPGTVSVAQMIAAQFSALIAPGETIAKAQAN